MDSYAPLFASITESSLWREAPYVRVVFLTMLAVKDWDHVVRKEDHHLCFLSHVTDGEFLNAIEILSKPDTESQIRQPYDGRRIERQSDGWLILNGEKYQETMRKLNKRAAAARRQREQRERNRVRDLLKAAQPLTKPSNGETDSEGVI